MDWKSHVEDVEKKLLKELVRAIDEEKVTDEETTRMAQTVLDRVDKAKDQNELLLALADLSIKWPFFANVEDIEKGVAQDAVEDKTEQDVLNLAKSGQVEEAITLAKTATEN